MGWNKGIGEIQKEKKDKGDELRREIETKLP